jgi:hypothetical protein
LARSDDLRSCHERKKNSLTAIIQSLASPFGQGDVLRANERSDIASPSWRPEIALWWSQPMLTRRGFISGSAAPYVSAKLGNWPAIAAATDASPNLRKPGKPLQPIPTGASERWTNWPQTFEYVCPTVFYPKSVAELSDAITRIPAGATVKAVGGGWSFTDAALPFSDQTQVNAVSIVASGQSSTSTLSSVLQPNNNNNVPLDLVPEQQDLTASQLTYFDQVSTTPVTITATWTPYSDSSLCHIIHVPCATPPPAVCLIKTSELTSSLQDKVASILSTAAAARVASGTNYFWVEAGITMSDLQQLLAHQNQPLTIQATSGNPLATLAGSLSTATHGAEVQWPLLTDTVRAIHLVGPGGEQWWIEGQGSVSIANQTALQSLYPLIDSAHFIGGAWNGISGLTALDVLHAVTVSMGTMGVIYSVILEVVPSFGVHQIVKPTRWENVLSLAGTTPAALASDTTGAASQAIINVLLDGTINGTGIAKSENVYADIAINPFNLECWIVNRRVTPTVPLETNSMGAGLGTYISTLSYTLSRNSNTSTVFGNPQNITKIGISSPPLGRVFDFLNYSTDILGVAGDVQNAAALGEFLTQSSFPDFMTAGLATASAQAVLNQQAIAKQTTPASVDTGNEFLGDVLTGVLSAILGTSDILRLSSPSNVFLFVGDFTQSGSDTILIYNNLDSSFPQGRWWLGDLRGQSIGWRVVSAAFSPFPALGASSGGVFALTGKFLGPNSGDQLLINANPDWWLGSVNSSNALLWTPVLFPGTPIIAPPYGELTLTPVTNATAQGNLWTGNFLGPNVADQILVLDASGNWWLGGINNGALTWATSPASSGLSSPFKTNINWVFAADFTGSGAKEVLVYDTSGNWWLGTFNTSGQLNWPASANSSTTPFGNLASLAPPAVLAIGNFAGTTGNQLLVFNSTGSPTNSWALGTFNVVGGTTQLNWSKIATTNQGSLNPQVNAIVTPNGFATVGKFLGNSADQLLFTTYAANNVPANNSWCLGSLSNGTLTWQSTPTSTTNPNFPNAPPFQSTSFWPINFNGGSGADQLLGLDGNFWVATFPGASNTPGPVWQTYSMAGYYVTNGPYLPPPYAVSAPTASPSSMAQNTWTGGALAMSDQIGSSNGVGSIGWPAGGLPGRGLEIALDPNKAFTFLQSTLLGVPGQPSGIIQQQMIGQINPLLGYISVRICSPTATLMGMQKFSPSVMVEIVGYRSPQSDSVMNAIQTAVLTHNQSNGLNAMLHWGLENDQLTAANLAFTPFNQPIASGAALTNIQAFQAVRKFFLGSNQPVFDNNFTSRLEL